MSRKRIVGEQRDNTKGIEEDNNNDEQDEGNQGDRRRKDKS